MFCRGSYGVIPTTSSSKSFPGMQLSDVTEKVSPVCSHSLSPLGETRVVESLVLEVYYFCLSHHFILVFSILVIICIH